MTDDQPWSMHSSSFSRADDPTHSMELEHDFSGGVRGKYLQQWNARLALAAEVLAIMQKTEREYIDWRERVRLVLGQAAPTAARLGREEAMAHAVAAWVLDREAKLRPMIPLVAPRHPFIAPNQLIEGETSNEER